jgi:hypothetical protein
MGLTTGCAFPFDHAATVAIWLLLAIASGWRYGGHVAGQVGSQPVKYRERWGYRPRTSLAAMTVALLLSLVPLIGESMAGASFCDDMFFGWAWLLVAPFVLTALVRVLAPMARLARADRGAAGTRRGRRPA